MPPSRPHRNFVIFETVKCTVKYEFIYYYVVTKVCRYQPENAPKALAAGLCPDPLGELQCSPRPLSWILEWGHGSRKEEGEKKGGEQPRAEDRAKREEAGGE